MSSNNLFDEKQILVELAKGDKVAFEKIYNFYSRKLYCKLLKLLKSKVIAEEILQDVFMIIWNNRSSVKPEKSFCSYLFCIATNKCYDHYRRVQRDKKSAGNLNQPSTYPENIEQVLISKETSGILYHAIELLPPKRKLIFRLCKVEGKTYEEVSLQLGISLSTISDHIVKANHFIKTHLVKGGQYVIG
ncbi:MAG: RNA polymerase sigma-70 factor [Ginsengibacter sp.]